MDAREADAAFRDSVRAWLAEHVPEGWAERMASATREEHVAFQRDWLRTLRDGGYAAPHWPKEFGGAELSLRQQVILYEESARGHAPTLDTYFVSLNHTPATLIAYGTSEQRAHLPLILDGELWCQGFSEPNAGSDLASLKTRAERRGDRYVVNGQKVWSSYADLADWCLLLARTDPDAPKRKGISFFLLDMKTPGVETRPIRQFTDEVEFCEIFLNDVEIPVDQRVGEENQGWTVAQTTLTSERGPAVLELEATLREGVARLMQLAADRTMPDGRRAADDGEIRQTLARAYGEVEILKLLCYKMISNLEQRGGVGPEASIIKIYYSELLQRLTEFGARLDGLPAQLATGPGLKVRWSHWLLEHFDSWSWTIAAGTNEIQRNLVGERVLGLPRDPAMS
jgi:alkylation response protein AidB-like acyl-CoA dehydrogenase